MSSRAVNKRFDAEMCPDPRLDGRGRAMTTRLLWRERMMVRDWSGCGAGTKVMGASSADGHLLPIEVDHASSLDLKGRRCRPAPQPTRRLPGDYQSERSTA